MAEREQGILYDGTFDGFLCVVYAVYYDGGLCPEYIQPQDAYQQSLSGQPLVIATEAEKARRVYAAFRKKAGQEAALRLYHASRSCETDIERDLLGYVVLGFKLGAAADTFLQNGCVARVHRLATGVCREAHLLKGFARFEKTVDDLMYCKISPKNKVLPLLAEHFCERFKNHPWLIHDTRHHQAAAYNGNGNGDFAIAAVSRRASVKTADGEDELKALWASFFNTISIKERESYKRQRQVLPLHFRGNMVEFEKTPHRP